MIRGRQGRLGLRDMTFSTFLDIVWVEVYDDVGPMADRGQYRRIIKELFLEGKPGHEIWFETTDDKGKKVRKRLTDAPATSVGGAIPKNALDQARQWRERAIEARKAADAAKAQAEKSEAE